MSTRPAEPPPLTIDQFLAAYSGADGRYELEDGVPVMMAGGTRRHARIIRNLFGRLDERLRGGPCEPFTSDMGLEVSATTYRLPDLAIYCDPRDLAPAATEPTRLRFPRVVFEILSKSTEAADHAVKLDEYQRLPSVDTIVFVHSSRRALTTFERTSANEWRTIVHLPGQPLQLRDPRIEITAAEIFAGISEPD